MPKLETKILNILKDGKPRTQLDLIETVSPSHPNKVKQAIRSLLNRGELKLTLDWKLRAACNKE